MWTKNETQTHNNLWIFVDALIHHQDSCYFFAIRSAQFPILHCSFSRTLSPINQQAHCRIYKSQESMCFVNESSMDHWHEDEKQLKYDVFPFWIYIDILSSYVIIRFMPWHWLFNAFLLWLHSKILDIFFVYFFSCVLSS